jgi:hypothetical protein
MPISNDSLGRVSLVVHEEELEVAGVVDEEGLVAGGHHVAGLLVVAVADLKATNGSAPLSLLKDLPREVPAFYIIVFGAPHLPRVPFASTVSLFP